MPYIPDSNGRESINNSTTTPLSSSSTFTGISDEVINYTSLIISCFSDKNSSSTGLQIQFSTNNTDWYVKDSFTYIANTVFTQTVIVQARYYRIVYINDIDAQTIFRLGTLLCLSPAKKISNSSNIIDLQGRIIDSFGRVRISNPVTLINITYTRDINTFQEIQTNTTVHSEIVKDSNAPMIEVRSIGSGASNAIVQSRETATYTPGKPLLIFITGIINANTNQTNILTQLGYYNNDCGFFFRHTGNGTSVGQLSVSIRNTVDGDILTTSTDWNIDKMDGNGPSGILLDTTKTQIFVIDLAWLGGGSVRFGFVINGVLWYCHQLNHANIYNLPYTEQISLPVRAELFSTGTALGSVKKICSTVISEGIQGQQGREFIYAIPINSLVNIGTTLRPIISFRLKNTGLFFNMKATIKSVSIINRSSMANRNIIVYVFYSPNGGLLSGSSFTSLNPDSCIDFDVTASNYLGTVPDYTTSNLKILFAGYLTETTSKTFNIPDTGYYLNNTIVTGASPVSSIISVGCRSSSSNTDIGASAKFVEYF